MVASLRLEHLLDSRYHLLNTMETATVREWHADEGWGVLDFASLPSGSWTLFSKIEMSGYHELRVGENVLAEYKLIDEKTSAELENSDSELYAAMTTRVLPNRS